MKAAIEVKNLTKEFAIPSQSMRLRAVDDLSFSVEEGSVFGLLGPNGSGKSTTIKALLDMLRPDLGTCLIDGVSSLDRRSRERVGYLPEGPFYYQFMEGLEFVSMIGQLGDLSKKESIARGIELLAKVGLEDAANRRIGGYSKGMLQRLGLAQALINDPKVLILDEPTAGVDPIGAVDIARIITSLKDEGKTILLCSHLLSQVEAICDSVVILDCGKIVASGTIDELLSEEQSHLEIRNCSEAAREKINSIANEENLEVRDKRNRKSLEQLFIDLTEKRGGKEL